MHRCAGILVLWVNVVHCYSQCDTNVFGRSDLKEIYRDYMTKHFGEQEPKPRRHGNLYFSLFPSSYGGQNRGGLITSVMASFYLGDPDSTNLSNVYFLPYITFEGQYILPLRSYIWSKNNMLNFTGDYRFMKYPQETYELGAYSKTQVQSVLDYYQVRFYQNALLKVYKDLAAGIGVQIDHYYNIRQKEKYIDSSTDWETYGDSSLSKYTSVGNTFDLVFDSRGNTINPQKGWFGRFAFRNNHPELGSTQTWNSIYLDARKYFKLKTCKRQVIALWALYWTITGGNPNYLDLPSNGWDSYGRTGRGLQRNRYRSTGMLYGEAEYRFDITRSGLWGGVLFLNATAPAEMNTQHYPQFHPAVGTGLRFKFDKRTGNNFLLDVGFSKNYWTWYMGLSEYF